MTDVTGENSGNCKNGRGGGISKNGKLQPKLRFKGFTDAWEQQQIEKIFNYERPDKYICFDKDIERSGAVPVLTANKAFILGYTNDSSNVYHRASIIFDDFTMDSKFVDFSYKVRSSALKILTVKADHDLYFAYTLLSNQHFPDMGHARHYISYVQKISVLLPNAEAQLTVSHLFRCLDSLIAAAERKVCLLKKKKHAYLNHIFTQHLRFTGHTTPLQTKKLGDISDIQTGSSDVQDAIPDGLYPFFVRSEVILRSNRYLYDGESILIPGEGRIGEVIHYYKGKFDYHQRVYKISDFVNRIVPKFIFFSMQYSFKKHALRHTVKATVDSLRLPTISSYTVNLSEESEQIKIVHFFQILDSLITATERKVNLLKKKKQAYLQKMFI